MSAHTRCSNSHRIRRGTGSGSTAVPRSLLVLLQLKQTATMQGAHEVPAITTTLMQTSRGTFTSVRRRMDLAIRRTHTTIPHTPPDSRRPGEFAIDRLVHRLPPTEPPTPIPRLERNEGPWEEQEVDLSARVSGRSVVGADILCRGRWLPGSLRDSRPN